MVAVTERRLRDPAWRAVVAAGAGSLAAVAVLATTRFGPGLTPDATTYDAAARSIRALHGVLASDGTPMVIFPPGYPLLLAAVSLLGPDVADAGRLVGAASIGLISALSVDLVLNRARRPLTALVLTGVALAASGSLLELSGWMLSDAPFSAIILLVLALLSRWRPVPIQRSDQKADSTGAMTSGFSRTTFAGLLVMGLLAPLVRYIGLVVPVLIAVVYVLRASGAWRARAIRGVLLMGVMLVPIGVWMARNWDVSRSLMGTRPSGGFAPDAILSDFGASVLRWLVPLDVAIPNPWPSLAGVALLVLVIALLIAGSRSWRTSPLFPFALFTAVYLVALGYSELTANIDPVSPRFMLPLFAPAVVLAALGVDRVGDALASRLGVGGVLLVTAAAAVAFAPVATRTARTALGAWRGGTGYYAPAWIWTTSPVIADLRERWPGTPVVSNENAAVYAFTRRYASQAPGLIDDPAGNEARAWAASLADAGTIIVWLHQPVPVWPDFNDARGRVIRLIPLESYPDGAILQFAVVGNP